MAVTSSMAESKYSDELSAKFEKLSNRKTSIRGVKVRGCYDSYREAENRAKLIIKIFQ